MIRLPFKIIRDDITRVRADAIVNTANPEPCFASGTDAAIYHAAGEEALLAERKKIGRIAPGEAAVTPAFRLPAKYIIHTVGPVWVDGRHREFEILASCYRKSMLLAEQLGCESIAFPLIASGVYGFPKDHALETALTAIRKYLETSELTVTIVVFDSSAYETASGLTRRIEAFIDDNYVEHQFQTEYGSARQPEARGNALRPAPPGNVRPSAPRGASPKGAAPQEDAYSADAAVPITPPSDAAMQAPPPSEAIRPAASRPSASRPFPFAGKRKKKAANAAPTMVDADSSPSLEDLISHLGETFQARLLRMIDESGMTDPEVYKRANIDRKLFSKIRCNEHYVPKKNTILAFALALRLNLDDTRDLLSSAGLLLTNNSKTDLIVQFCIEHQIYDIFEVNALLFKFDQPILG